MDLIHSQYLQLASELAPIVTTLLALLIYFEAKHLREIDGHAKTIEHWQEFNKLVIEKELGDRWQAVYSGRLSWKDMTHRDKALIYTYLNVLRYEYLASRAGVLNRLYAHKSMGDNILSFRFIWPELYAHLRKTGWSVEFLDAANAIVLKAGQRRATTAGNQLQRSQSGN